MQKRIWRKTLSMILVLTLLVSVIPLQVYAIAGDALASTITDDAVVSLQEPLATQRVVEEDESRRSEFSKEFVLNNGLRLATVYPSAIHYEDNGTWKDIDNTLIAAISDGESVYTNTAGRWNICFPQSLSGNNMIGIAMNGFTVQFGMAGELRSTGDVVVASVGQIGSGETASFTVSTAQTSVAQIQQVDLTSARAAAEYPETVLEKMYSRLTYANIYPNTNIVYDLQGNKLKESVIMQHYDADLWGYRYTLDTGDLIPILNENQQIDLCDPNTNEVVLTMPAPYLVDNNGEYNDNVQVSLTRSGSMYLLSYYLPREWLADSARAWPVILDPVISGDCSSTNIHDNTVSEIQKDTYIDATIECGCSTITGVNRTYMKYVNLPKLTSADVIVEAKISMLKLREFSISNIVEVHKVSRDWNTNTITWDNKPDYVDTIEDYVVCQNAGRYEWDVTDIARDWYANTNTGMLFKAPDATENLAQSWQQFASSDYSAYPDEAPVLEIIFRNANGLENYWDYTAHSAGRAGVGYVNNYNGNLVWIHNDIGFGGNRMPVSIYHVYNANDSENNRFGMGYGWRTNYNQRVYKWKQDTNYYVWEDGDGTCHYFYKVSNGKYVDEDGLYLTLTTTGSGTSQTCEITDQYGNISYFNTSGNLVKIENNQQTKSSITIAYTSNSAGEARINTITDGAGRVYSFTYTNDLLTDISYKGSGTSVITNITFGYSGSKLIRITDKDGKYVTYTYDDNNLLLTAQDVDGYKLQYTYNIVSPTTTYQPSRVATITEYDVRNIEDPDDDKLGGQISIEYANNQTTFTDHNGNIQIVQFNNWGNPVAVMDGEGRGQFATYKKPETQTEKGNQLKLSSKLQNTVGNMMVDNSFELAWLWTATSDDINQEISTEEAYYGSKSLKMTRSVAGAAAGVFEPSFAALPGESYTFSAYVKTSEGAAAYLQIVDNVQVTVTSETLPGNSDWTRLEVTYTNKTSANRIMRVRLMTETAGTVYMDCVQLEKAPTASRYNLIDNGDFGAWINWTASSGAGTNIQRVTKPESEDDKTILELDQLDNYAYQFIGNPQGQLYLKQDVLVSGNANDTFVLAGWAKGDSVPLKDDRKFCLRGVFTYTDGTTSKEEFEFSFNPDADSSVNWQYAAGMMRAKKAYTKITVYVVYDYNANTVLFDGIQLYKEEFGTELTYNEYGDVTDVEDIQGQKTEYTYDPETHDLTKITLPDGTETTYTYDAYHNVLTSTSYTGVVTTYTYDTWGNNLTVSVGSGSSKITSSAAYSADGNRLVSATDTAGKVTQYSYHQDTNVLEWVQYPEDTAATRTAYTYDEMYRLTNTQVTTDQNSTLTASYTYDEENGLLTGLTTASTTYSFTYGDFSLRSRVAIGSRTLAQYTYSEQNNFLERLDYGNGDRVQYEYDQQGRVTRQTYENGDTVTYRYDNNGALASVTDSATGRTTTYYYDFTNRLMKYVESGDVDHSVQYTYDDQNKLTDLVEVINGVTQTTHYTYDDDQRISSIQNGDKVISYTYDEYGRVSQKTDGIFTYAYTYKSTDTGASSNQIDTVSVMLGGDACTTFQYTYDDNGNILSTIDTRGISTYVYDSAGQLIRENNLRANRTWVWTYDDAGNILSKSEYAYSPSTLRTPIDTIVYTYGDADWGDLLTAYDGVPITYDEMGNPLSDGTWAYTWEHGRQLAAMTNGSTIWTYTYDANGMRTSRSNGSTTYTYVYNGSKLMQMTVGNYKLTFTYDGSGNPSTVTLNNTTFYYVTNLQGDVVEIRNASGALVCYYCYDAWGNTIYTSGNGGLIVSLNPLRYRGYVYDQDTGFYYLQSRYYNPAIGRFLNADAFASTGQGALGNNMFSYCLNNPVNAIDPLGEDAIWLQDTNNRVAGILGHTGLLIQDETGTWYYFNWTNSNCSFYKVDPEKFDYTSIKSLMKIDGNRYDATIYFEGDFSGSIKYAEMLKKNFSKKDYKLMRNNCMQVVTDVLMRGNFAQSDGCYKLFLQRIRSSMIPNVAYSRMVNFHNAVLIYHAAPRWAKWLYTSPERAVWIY